MQGVVDSLFADADVKAVRRLDVVLAAEASDMPDDLMEIVKLLPQMCIRDSLSSESAFEARV